MNAFWIILTGSLVAACCSLLGCYLILRRMAMVGDAISHAVLPGIVIAFLLTGSRDSVPMLIGAGLLGVLTTFLIEFFHRYARVQSDAAIGVTFTWLFAIGIILISVFAGQVDLDQDCVLYGEIAYVPLDLWITEGGLSMGPRTVWTLGLVTIIILLFIVIGYKELFLTAFDSGYAAAIGVSTSLWYYLLMTAVSLTTVASFESVGAILVVALLVAPPATAYLLTDNFKTMLILSVVLGILAAFAGYYLAVWIDGSIAGAIATVTGIEFMIAFLFSPSRGILMSKKLIQPVQH
ncbi:metal ABC transporter permease [Pontibacter sp. H249]|uniref:metal ABC transporter permease n=1 Tax=Pontibacter sp. H249 TaxID=3133420 RepID=UPI0030BADE56